MRRVLLLALFILVEQGCTPNVPPSVQPQQLYHIIGKDISGEDLLCAQPVTGSMFRDCMTVARFRAIVNSMQAQP